MIYIGIDPGPEASALVAFDGERVREHFMRPNLEILRALRHEFDPLQRGPDGIGAVCFEQVESFGMAVGASVHETNFWTGRMFQVAVEQFGIARVDRLVRKRVKHHLCNSIKAKDANVRQALIDRFGGEQAIGTKKAQGPLYGVRAHEWAALAVAVTKYDESQPH